MTLDQSQSQVQDSMQVDFTRKVKSIGGAGKTLEDCKVEVKFLVVR